MIERYTFKDESGDKKYFTQIPNMIVNHSTAYEQSLYLTMKRLAGEGGLCWASLNFLSEKMGVHKTTVSKTIKKLLDRKWIKEVEPMVVPGGKVRQFKIVDLWKLNMSLYKGGSQMTTIKNRGGAEVTRGGAHIDRGGAQSDTSKKSSNIKKDTLSFGKKPHYDGMVMRFSKGKWWLIPKGGGPWLEFAGRKEDVIYK